MNDQAESMAEFTSLLLEHIIHRTGTTKLRAKQVGNEIYATVGDKNFAGTGTKVMELVLRHVLECQPKLTEAEYAELAKARDAIMAAQAKDLVEELTEGGMSVLGRQTEQLRQRRAQEIQRALTIDIKAQPAAPSMNDLLTMVRDRTGFHDLDLPELLAALRTH